MLADASGWKTAPACCFATTAQAWPPHAGQRPGKTVAGVAGS
jgi:hypothetical protein